MHIMHFASRSGYELARARETRCISYSEWRNVSQFTSHLHSGLPIMELGFSCVFMCMHPIFYCAFRLLGHHASVCLIVGTRIEECIYMWKYIAMPHSCTLLQQNKESANFQSLARFPRITAKQRLIGASRWISAQGSPDTHHPIRSKAVPGLHASFTVFLVNLLIN